MYMKVNLRFSVFHYEFLPSMKTLKVMKNKKAIELFIIIEEYDS